MGTMSSVAKRVLRLMFKASYDKNTITERHDTRDGVKESKEYIPLFRFRA